MTCRRRTWPTPMVDRQPVFEAATIDAGVARVLSLGPGLVVVDLLHVIAIPSMAFEGWSVFFEELAARTREHDVEPVVLAAASTIDVAEKLTSPAAVRVIARGRPRNVADAVRASAPRVTAVWAVESITNARLARELGVPLIAAAPMKRTRVGEWSRRTAQAFLLDRAAPSPRL